MQHNAGQGSFVPAFNVINEGGMLIFPTSSDYDKAIKFVSDAPSATVRQWEESIGFTSLNTMFEKAIEEINQASSQEEAERLFQSFTSKRIIAVRNNIVEPLVYDLSRAAFMGEKMTFKVADGFYYTDGIKYCSSTDYNEIEKAKEGQWPERTYDYSFNEKTHYIVDTPQFSTNNNTLCWPVWQHGNIGGYLDFNGGEVYVEGAGDLAGNLRVWITKQDTYISNEVSQVTRVHYRITSLRRSFGRYISTPNSSRRCRMEYFEAEFPVPITDGTFYTINGVRYSTITEYRLTQIGANCT